MSTLFKQILKIQDDTFEVDLLHEYILSIQLTPTHFRFCVIDAPKNKCVSLEDYQLIVSSTQESDYLAALQQLFECHSFLQAGFWKSVKVSVKNNFFTLIPAPFFLPQTSEVFTNDFFTIDKNKTWFDYTYTKDDLVCLFTANPSVLDWIKFKYPKKQIDFLHNALTHMEASSWTYREYKTSAQVFVHVDVGYINITLRKNGKLEICNQFEYHTPNDLLYFVLLIFSEFDLDPEKIPVILSGEITKTSDAYYRLYKYIRNIDFASKPQILKLGYKFDEVPDHLYNDLLMLYAC